jgi:hypothetical protein
MVQPTIAECERSPYSGTLDMLSQAILVPRIFAERVLMLGDRIITAPGQMLEMEEKTLQGRKYRVWKNVS